MKGPASLVNGPSLKFALRAFRTEIQGRSVWLVLATVSIVVTLAGPFDTDDVFPLLPRLLYWAVLVHLTYFAGFIATMSLQPVVRHWPFLARAIVQSLAVSAVVIPIVLIANLLVLGVAFGPSTAPGDALSFIAILALICALVTSVLLVTKPPEATAQEKPKPKSPALLDRLPFEKRGPLISISAEGHHVRVQTAVSEHWLRMRLADAIAETAPVEGLQVHRSHWVALAAVASVRRDGKRATITMTHGAEIPVSRARLSDLKEARLLV